MKTPSFNVYLGIDENELLNVEVCKYSLKKHSKIDFDILELDQKELRELDLYWRPLDERAATQFSLTRFLIPELERLAKKHTMGFLPAYSVFVDSDNCFTRDVSEVFAYVDPENAVSVVKHDYIPKKAIKMDGQVQYPYRRKNWSSFIVFNNRHPANERLTLNIVNSALPSYLHQFGWLEDFEIGALPVEYNYLVDDLEWPTSARLPLNSHYSSGSPIFPGLPEDVRFRELWLAYEKEMIGLSSCLSGAV